MEPPKNEHFISASQKAPRWAAFINKWMCYIMYDIGIGPRLFKAATIINISATLQILLFGFGMYYYQNNSVAAWVYFVMAINHELVWLLKNRFFPDASWEYKQTLASSIAFFTYLIGYWVVGWMLVSGYSHPSYPLPDNAWYALCLVLNFIGCMLMTAADAQKNSTLQIRPGLIETGMFKTLRQPNYVGQILVYATFPLMVWHWLSTLIIAIFIFFIFIVNMVMKEASMSRHPGWAAYKKKTWLFFPGLF